MDLKSYRDKMGKTQKECAEELDITIPYYSDLERRVYLPSRKLAQEIIKWSDSEITFEDLWE